MLASKAVKKHQTNNYNNRGTITIAWCGLASGVDGPCFYLVKAEKIDFQTFKGDFAKKHKAPPGSKFIPTPNAYMTDKVWNKLAAAFSKEILDLPLIKDYPEFWMFLTLDGYGSHMQGNTLKIISDYNRSCGRVEAGRFCKEAQGSSWVEIHPHTKCIHDQHGLERAGSCFFQRTS